MMLQRYVWLAVTLAICYQIYTNERYKGAFKKFVAKYVHGFTNNDNDRLFHKNELKRYNSVENGLYLSIIGNVFDVTAGVKHYGPGATYHAFTGRDASMAFVTGEFTDEASTDDVSTLSASQCKAISGWIKFYRENYIYKGKLVGRYYDENGEPTDDYQNFAAKVTIADKERSREDEKMSMFPPCNVEWKPDVGTRLWCTKQSGGIAREWIGVPRRYFERSKARKYRCACVNLDSQVYRDNAANFRVYEGCPERSNSCSIDPDTLEKL